MPHSSLQILQRLLCSLLPVCLSTILCAQEYSYDGNRWIEVELIVFSNPVNPEQQEESLPGNVVLSYLPGTTELRPASASFMIDFDPLPVFSGENDIETEIPPAQALPTIGPRRVLPVKADFRIDDFSRDPYIALDGRSQQLTRELQRLQSTPDHDILWHGMWRQPLQDSAQTRAVSLIGGDRFAMHNQLEGSIRFSNQGARAQMEMNLWFAYFQTAGSRFDSPWILPPQPESSVMANAPNPELLGLTQWQVQDVWQLQKSEAVEPGKLVYLDNPAFGVLFQVRPYVLPLNTMQGTADDF